MQMQCTPNRLSRTANDLESFFNQVFGDTLRSSGKFNPPGDVMETDSSFVVHMELPGIRLEDISVEFIDKTLKISGEKKVTHDESTKACHCCERQHGRFQRAFAFPTEVDGDKVDARFENGLLIVTLPKAEKVLPRKVEIKIGG